MNAGLQPLLFAPVYKDYLWGGGRMRTIYPHKPACPLGCAESWEISDRPEGMSVVSSGPLAGRTLQSLVTEWGPSLTGDATKPGGFPLLIKLIDARDRLSVQVHPDEDGARVHGGEPKTEMWYALDATRPGASVFAGLKPNTTQASFEAALQAGTVSSLLHQIPIQPGDSLFVPGGRVHAIGEGCFFLEVQQSSNTTYRVYDWDRVGPDGKPRALHLAQALRVIQWTDTDVALTQPIPERARGGNTWRKILDCPFFAIRRLDLTAPEPVVNDGRSFHALFVAAGTVTIRHAGPPVTVAAGASCLLPAGVSGYDIQPAGGSAQVLQIRVA